MSKYKLIDILCQMATDKKHYSAQYLDKHQLGIYQLARHELLVTDRYCVVITHLDGENIRDCLQPRHFNTAKEAKHEVFMLKLKGVKSKIYSKKYCNIWCDLAEQWHQKLSDLRECDREMSTIVDEINDLHKDVRITYDCCPTEFAKAHEEEQALKIYKLLKQLREKSIDRFNIEFATNTRVLEVEEYNRPTHVQTYSGDLF